ncbi:acyltransferase [Chishuiella sp.]|uniref:acyltransferase family protein n=1 Tax=Chishuiella sp. TaxID=1969467 RepID=UPI0028AE8764|nr:acyltransferase [Chishuiella sp.]
MEKSYRTENNFDFLRLLFASAVVFSHSYSLTAKEDIVYVLTNKQINLGWLSVDIFFILSGYLILSSLKYSKSIQNYLWKRVLRLYPALFILLLFTLLLVPFVYVGKNILKEASFWSYAPRVLSLFNVQIDMNNVFKNNPYPSAVNGSLWSLCYEFLMYILLLVIYPFRNKNKLLILFFLLAFICSYILFLFKPTFLNRYFSLIYIDTFQLYRLSKCFFAGCLLYLLKLEKLNYFFVRVICISLITLSIYLNLFKYIGPLLLPIFILLIGQLKTNYISGIINKIGDISYGIYIYGFFVQQYLMYFFKLNVIELTIYGMFFTGILAYFSWNFIEKPMQKYKMKF